jgi:hypothetical protein
MRERKFHWSMKDEEFSFANKKKERYNSLTNEKI